MDDLVERDGLYYQKFTKVPFTGEIDEGVDRGSIKNGMREGLWIHYYEDGQLNQKGEYKNGEKEGLWVIHNANGRIKLKGNFLKGVKDGFWFEEDFLGYGTGDYKNGNREGLWIFFYDYEKQVLRKKVNFNSGVENGPFESFWESGQKKAKGLLSNGKRQGNWIFYDSDGSIYKPYTGIFKNDEKVSD